MAGGSSPSRRPGEPGGGVLFGRLRQRVCLLLSLKAQHSWRLEGQDKTRQDDQQNRTRTLEREIWGRKLGNMYAARHGISASVRRLALHFPGQGPRWYSSGCPGTISALRSTSRLFPASSRRIPRVAQRLRNPQAVARIRRGNACGLRCRGGMSPIGACGEQNSLSSLHPGTPRVKTSLQRPVVRRGPRAC